MWVDEMHKPLFHGNEVYDGNLVMNCSGYGPPGPKDVSGDGGVF